MSKANSRKFYLSIMNEILVFLKKVGPENDLKCFSINEKAEWENKLQV